MVVRICDRCGIRLGDDESAGAYRATLTRADGDEQIIADYADICDDCMRRLKQVHEPRQARRALRSRTAQLTGGSRLTREEAVRLRKALVDILNEKGGRATNDEIYEELQRRGVKLPGSAPRRNLTSYLSRHEQIRNLKPGLWGLREHDKEHSGTQTSSASEQGE